MMLTIPESFIIPMIPKYKEIELIFQTFTNNEFILCRNIKIRVKQNTKANKVKFIKFGLITDNDGFSGKINVIYITP